MQHSKMELVGNTAIVTGGARGIGYAISDALMTYGASVAIFDTNEEIGKKAAQELTGLHKDDGVKAIFIRTDVTDAAGVEASVQKAIEALGSVHILINNAGVDHEHVATWDVSEEVWDLVMDVDLKGTYQMIKAIVPYWIKNKIEGSICNTTSGNYNMATDGLSAYCAAKAGASQLTKVVAGEGGRYGIRCNSIAPGLTITDMTRRFAEGPAGKPFYERTPMFEHSSRARAADPEDLAKSVVFLSSNYASWITGITLSIDGGCHIRGLHSYMDADYFAEYGKMPVVEW